VAEEGGCIQTGADDFADQIFGGESMAGLVKMMRNHGDTPFPALGFTAAGIEGWSGGRKIPTSQRSA